MGVNSRLRVVVLLTSICLHIQADDPKVLKEKLESKFIPTVINAEGAVVTAGVTLTLKKPGFVAASEATCVTEVKDGAIVLASGASKAACSSTTRKVKSIFSKIPGVGANAQSAPTVRPFVKGEKLYITKIDVKDYISFTLISDLINDVTYKAEMRFHPKEGAPLDLEHVESLVSEAFTVAPPEAPEQTAQQQQAPPAPAAASPAPVSEPPLLPDIAPPPPPPDQPAAPPPTVKVGQTIDQVVAILGQPTTFASVGPKKKIYSYKALNVKVTFVDGKVTDVQ